MTADAQSRNPVLEYKDIIKYLPHRYPFLMIDKVIELDIENGILVAQKNVSINEAYFQGHFPGTPIMPGVLLLEALAQTGSLYVQLKEPTGKVGLLLNIKNAKFRQPVRPGDILILRGREIHLGSKGGRLQGEAYVGDKIVAEAEFGYVLVDPSQI